MAFYGFIDRIAKRRQETGWGGGAAARTRPLHIIVCLLYQQQITACHLTW